MLRASRGSVALNNMAVHMMERGRPVDAVEAMKNALRMSASDQTKESQQNRFSLAHGCCASSAKDLIENGAALCSSVVNRRYDDQIPTKARPHQALSFLEVNPVEYEDLPSLATALDLIHSRPCSLSPLYLRDAIAVDGYTSPGDGHMFCAILLYNHGLACFLAYLSGALTSGSSALDYLSEAHLSLDTVHWICTTFFPDFLPDDLSLMSLSILSLASLSLVLQSKQQTLQALRAQLTAADLWTGMKRDAFTHVFMLSTQRISAASA